MERGGGEKQKVRGKKRKEIFALKLLISSSGRRWDCVVGVLEGGNGEKDGCAYVYPHSQLMDPSRVKKTKPVCWMRSSGVLLWQLRRVGGK